MKTLKLAIAACVSAFTLAGTASAQGLFNFEKADGFIYTSGYVGAIFPDDIGAVELDTDITYGGALGARLPFRSLGFIHTRIELELDYAEVDAEIEGVAGSSPLENLFILGNSYGDFIWRENQRVVPYFGGGLGVAITDAPGAPSSTNFTTHNAIGLTVPVNQLDLYAEGRYFKIYADGPNLDGITLTAGLRYKF